MKPGALGLFGLLSQVAAVLQESRGISEAFQAWIELQKRVSSNYLHQQSGLSTSSGPLQR